MLVWLVVVMAGMMNACTRPDGAENQILVPVEAEFEDLFVLEDTIRLDAAVLIGTVSSLDINSTGELLVLDRQGQAIHVFSPNGAHVRSLSITDCNPEATFGFRAHAQFLDDSRVIAVTDKGAVVFGHEGQCLQSSQESELVTRAYSVCQRDDTVFVMPMVRGDSIFIRAYDQEFVLIDQIPLPGPRFPSRAYTMLPFQGRTMACFSDDVWWIYGENHDASPRLTRGGLQRYKPASFRERTQDWTALPLVTQDNFQEIGRKISEMERAASTIQALFKLDESVRMLEYSGLDPLEEVRGGILITSHEGAFEAVTAHTAVRFDAAGYGFAYVVETPEDDHGDALTNPLILSHRFVPPGE